MPRPKQTEEQIAAMRERILDAAFALLSEQGFGALSVRAIAKQVGVSHMVLYTYFENRAALMTALSERQLERMQAHHAEILQQAETGDLCQVLRESLAFFAQMAQTRPRSYQFLWVQPTDSRHCARRHRHLGNHQRHLSRLIKLGIERGVLTNRDPDLAAATVLSIVNGPLILYHSGRLPDEDLRDRMGEETLQAAMDYLCGQMADYEE
jgi:AcrR family transcriptional regulator